MITDGFTDEPVRLQVRVAIDEEGVLFDLTGCDPQRRAPVNSTYSQTFAACAYVLKCLIDQDVPVNAGFYEQVRLVAPEGTVVNCTAPSPVVGGWETQVRLSDIILKALHPGAARYDPGRDQGDDVPSRLRRHRPAHRAALFLLRDHGRRLWRAQHQGRAGRRAVPRSKHRERAD